MTCRSAFFASFASFLALLLSACAGGNGKPSTGDTRQCGEAGAFCLTSCSVGCREDGCAIGEIAQNQRLRFQFSQPVDPSTVGLDTISLKTPEGSQADGEFIVEDAVITFIPEIRRIGAQTFFGFASNEEYLLTLPGRDSPFSLRSTAGDPLTETVTCSLRSTLGVVDLDASPPRASVLAPSVVDDLPADTTFVLTFSEVLDPSPFTRNPSGSEAPIQFRLLTLLDGGDCESGVETAELIDGRLTVEENLVADSTMVTFRPNQLLPTNRCVEVSVTGTVRDLSGRPADRQVFRFTTRAVQRDEFIALEEFADTTQFDAERSAGAWGGGSLTFFSIGGDGRNGDFDYERGFYDTAADEWVIDTDAPWIGDADALVENNGSSGIYHFTRFVIPEGIRVRFRGSLPARIHVRGTCQIDGELRFGGGDLEPFAILNEGTNLQRGQSGSLGGPGGGRGGDGGQQGDGNGVRPEFHGQNGEDLSVPPSHARTGALALTGGRGSRQFPEDGLSSSIDLSIFGRNSGQGTNGGGGGGGPLAPGGDGRVVQPGRPANSTEIVPTPLFDTPGGRSLAIGPLPGGVTSSEHFLVGGAGGGGAGSHTFYQVDYIAGAGGGGGGGAMRLRVGRSLRIGAAGVLDGSGGSAASIASQIGPNEDLPAPGGGGSGGALLVQLGSDRALTLDGRVDVSGGVGGEILLSGFVFRGEIRGGDGAPGIFRIETPDAALDPSLWQLGTSPAPSASTAAVLVESDDLAGVVSRVFDTGAMETPVYRRYEIDAEVDGVAVTFSDDPSIGLQAIEGAALRFFVQGVALDPATGEISTETSFTDWVQRVASTPGQRSLNSIGRTAFRWLLVRDRSIAQDVRVTRVAIVYAI